MAVIKLGPLVSDIAGSIGGTTFRRFGSSRVVTSKSGGGSRNSLLKNQKINVLSNLSFSWAALEPNIKEGWNDRKEDFLFPDKFGVMRAISGRLLFQKLNGHLSHIGVINTVFSTLNNSLPAVTFEIADFSISEDLFNFCVSGDSFTGHILLQGEWIGKSSKSPTFTRRKTFKTLSYTGPECFDIWDAIISEFPQIYAGGVIRLYVRFMNSSGFVSPTAVVEATAS